MKYSYFLYKKYAAVFFLILFFAYVGTAQVMGINTADPQSSIDIRGLNNNGTVTATDGLLAPRVNSLATAGAQNGQLVYLIADSGNLKKGFYNWNGTSWRPIILNSSPTAQGNSLLPDVDIPGTAGSVTAFAVTPSPGTAIANNRAIDVPITVTGIVGNTTFVSIRINISHTRDNDLDIFLQAPTGQILELSTDNGGSANNYTNTVFIDSGLNNITAGTAPFTNSFRPEGTANASGPPVSLTGTIAAFSGFNGLNPNGNWILRIGDDNTNADTGTFNSATLNISGTSPANWVLIGESSITYLNDMANIIKSTYSADPTDLNGVITALTRSTSSAGSAGTSIAALPGAVLNYSSASPSGTGNFWVNTFNQTQDIGLTDNTVYFYQLWRKGNIENPIASNETFSLIPMRIEQ
ncbi:proprotein convertase P-domain-containing protein [Aequorivita antarctica]|uniref:P/Homo B domain-containing protein n=1 Tax=Aequorivita antarctica TaxID=153266 RepID=A0A5C6YXU4_9FLAO|nr:proprotein convertase P-domain-containing protein [Aequorivita antarctica]TXD72520.1 hypothetical protein ESU54_11950 [Aequorivita antarctica]SRX75386.1 hypothetical protein AEQU3_02380 [Aequorivita antarctica]